LESITISAPMTGSVIEVLVSDGDAVSRGDILVLVESMKMENEIISEHDAPFSSVHVSELQTLSEGDAMLEIETGWVSGSHPTPGASGRSR